MVLVWLPQDWGQGGRGRAPTRAWYTRAADQSSTDPNGGNASVCAESMPSLPRLPRAYFARSTVAVALGLLGTYLVHDGPRGRQVGRVVETEAYVGPDDRASHAARGYTPRTRLMFGPPGFAYVYLVYGMHHCLNVVTERPGFPAAVLLRALEPVAGLTEPTNGPGRLCRALGVDRSHDGGDLTLGPLYLVPADAGALVAPEQVSPSGPWRVVAGPRVGVAYAGAWALKP